jgi:hypothetical protein
MSSRAEEHLAEGDNESATITLKARFVREGIDERGYD